MSSYWWLSFVDPERPEGARFLGVLVIGPAVDMKQALQTAWIVGLNPGGEVQGLIIPQAAFEATPLEYRGRLLNREECSALDEFWQASMPAQNGNAPS